MMDRLFVFITAAIIMNACVSREVQGVSEKKRYEVMLHISHKGAIKDGGGRHRTATKTIIPDEELVSDLNLLVFDDEGMLEARHFITGLEKKSDTEGFDFQAEIRLAGNRKYDIYACANLGYALDTDNLGKLLEYRYHLAYPDEFSSGLPMAVYECGVYITGNDDIYLNLERCAAKISLTVDRSRLDEDVKWNVRSASIGNCPRSVCLFGQSSISGPSDVFPVGFMLKGTQVDALNHNQKALSDEISLYMLENLFGNDKSDASWAELEVDYISSNWYSPGKSPVKYRFMLTGEEGEWNICRNCEYRYTIRPAGDALASDGWSVDRESLIGK